MQKQGILFQYHIDVVALQCAVARLGHDQFRAAYFALHSLTRLVHGIQNLPFLPVITGRFILAHPDPTR